MKQYPDIEKSSTSPKVAESVAATYALPQHEARQQATVEAIMLMYSTLDEDGRKYVAEKMADDTVSIEAEFNYHFGAWEKETGILSNPFQIVANPHFTAIVEMGKAVVPFVLRSISERPSLLFRSLDLIYNEKVSKYQNEKSFLGIDVKKSCEAWIKRL